VNSIIKKCGWGLDVCTNYFVYIFSYLLEEDNNILIHNTHKRFCITYHYYLLLFLTAVQGELLMFPKMLCSALYLL
jgi:hypothetical protein